MRALFRVCTWSFSSWVLRGRETGRHLLRALMPSGGIHSHDLITSQGPHLQLPLHWGFELQCRILWGHNSVHNRKCGQGNFVLGEKGRFCSPWFMTSKPYRRVLCLVTQPHPTLWPYGLQPARLLCPWDSPGKNTGVGCHALLLPNPGLLHCRGILYCLSHQGSPYRRVFGCKLITCILI